MQKTYLKSIFVASCLLVFSALFFQNTASDAPLIFKKDLLAHDESSNSVVASNITRKVFPPMVRTNPLVEGQGNWMEGPYWQHIPPLFAYVPYVPFLLDGGVTIEVKRLSFAALVWFTGLLFIYLSYRLSKSLWVGVAATAAAVIWARTPFTRELITGYAFGVSDIVLSFMVILAFSAIVWYLKEEKEGRREYPWWKISLISAACILPLLAKNLLGAIPAAILVGFLIRDFRFSIKFWQGIASMACLALLYYVPLFLASPETFKSEILISFFHVSDYEGWGRPWHYYFSNYLPDRYLFSWTFAFWLGLLFSGWFLVFGGLKRVERLLLGLSIVWFLWNLAAITLVESKIANFIFQSYLLSLFAISLSAIFTLRYIFQQGIFEKIRNMVYQYSSKTFILFAVAAIVFAGVSLKDLVVSAQTMRGNPYAYESEREKFYQTGEELKVLGLGTQDLTIVRVSNNDCWLRYNILFLTGAESKALLEMSFGFDPIGVKNKYSRMHFIVQKDNAYSPANGVRSELSNFSRIEFDLTQMGHEEIDTAIKGFVAHHANDIAADITRIKKDLTSCQWLVPDPILNAP